MASFCWRVGSTLSRTQELSEQLKKTVPAETGVHVYVMHKHGLQYIYSPRLWLISTVSHYSISNAFTPLIYNNHDDNEDDSEFSSVFDLA